MFQKKKRYSICLDKKLHGRLTRFAKKTKRPSLSAFFAELGEKEMVAERKRKKSGQKIGVFK